MLLLKLKRQDFVQHFFFKLFRFLNTALRVFSCKMQCCESGMCIADPDFFPPGSNNNKKKRGKSKQVFFTFFSHKFHKIFNPKNYWRDTVMRFFAAGFFLYTPGSRFNIPTPKSLDPDPHKKNQDLVHIWTTVLVTNTVLKAFCIRRWFFSVCQAGGILRHVFQTSSKDQGGVR